MARHILKQKYGVLYMLAMGALWPPLRVHPTRYFTREKLMGITCALV